MAVKKKIYSYIKYPFSWNGWFSFGLSVLAFILTQIIVYRAVASGGSVGPVTAALGLCSMLIDLTAGKKLHFRGDRGAAFLKRADRMDIYFFQMIKERLV